MLIELPHNWQDVAKLRRPQAAARRREWYRIEAKAADEPAEVYIYDEIGDWGTTAQQFVKDLQAVKAGQINLHLNTPGGDVFDGIAIHNALVRHPASVTTYVDGLAASIGSVIAMAGDRIVMMPHSTMMIHDPFGGCLGNCDDMAQMAMILDKLGGTIAGVYAERTIKMPIKSPRRMPDEWRRMMKAETWMSGREAVEMGLADEVDGDAAEDEKTANRFDLSAYRHPPAALAARADVPASPPTIRDLERALRDAGLTRAQAKALLAKGCEALDSEDDDEREVSELVALLGGLRGLNTQ